MQIGIFAAVILPLCGYCGAKHHSRLMLLFFSCCNCVVASFFIASFISVMTMNHDYITCVCNGECRAKNHFPAPSGEMCDDTSRFRALFWVAMGIAFGMAVLQIMGCMYGWKLMNLKHYAVSNIPVAQSVFHTHTVATQPSGFNKLTAPLTGSATAPMLSP